MQLAACQGANAPIHLGVPITSRGGATYIDVVATHKELTVLPPGGRPDHTDIARACDNHCTLAMGGGVASATAHCCSLLPPSALPSAHAAIDGADQTNSATSRP